MAQVCRWAAEQGFLQVTLTTFRTVPWNAPFYEKLGFVELAPVAWTPGLRARAAAETAAGLPAADRAVLGRNLSPEKPRR